MALFGLLALALGACHPASGDPNPATVPDAPDAHIVRVTLTDFAVAIQSEAVPVGVPIAFRIVNRGMTKHNVALEPVGAVDMPLVSTGGAPARTEALNPGQEVDLVFTFLPEHLATSGGTFQLGCHLPGHYEAGMWAEFNVTEAPAP